MLDRPASGMRGRAAGRRTFNPYPGPASVSSRRFGGDRAKPRGDALEGDAESLRVPLSGVPLGGEEDVFGCCWGGGDAGVCLLPGTGSLS